MAPRIVHPAEISVDDLGEVLVLVITRPRPWGDRPPKTRHIYLTPDEAAQVIERLSHALKDG